MSSESAQSSHVASVSFRFVLKWDFKLKEVKEDMNYCSVENDENDKTHVMSDLYVFKSAQDLWFYLEILENYYNLSINIKGSKMWSFEIAYAFLVNKKRAYRLKESPQLSFLPLCYRSCLSDDVLVHCLVKADPVYPPPSNEQDDLPFNEGQNRVIIESRQDICSLGHSKEKMVIDFIRRGDIPSLSVSQAIKIIRETENHKCEVLKILCVRYLYENITAESIRQISRAAIDCGLPDLERACIQKIADGYFNIK